MRSGPKTRRGWSARHAGALAGAAVLCAAAAPATAVSAGDAISLAAAPAEIRSGATLELTGTLRWGAAVARAGALVELEADPFPYRGFFDLAHTVTAIDGTFAFGPLRPDRNTRYRIRSVAGHSPVQSVYVDAPATLHSYDRGPGRTMLTLLSTHSPYFRWIGVPVYWYVARLGSASFQLAAITRTRELRPGVTYATATVNPPARRFVYRVCLNPASEAGAGPPAVHAACPRGGFDAERT
jgi:hypothetical protein